MADGTMMKKAWMGFDQFMPLADASMEGLLVTELHGGMLDVNRTALEKLRSEEQDLVGARSYSFERGFPVLAAGYDWENRR